MSFDLKKNPIPRDEVAARIVFRKGVYEPFRHTSSEKCSTLPLPTREVPKGTDNFVGFRKGWLTVVGLYNGPEVGARPCGSGRRSKPSGHGWVCRCSCGNYTVRKTKSLKKQRFDACIECTLRKHKRDGLGV